MGGDVSLSLDGAQEVLIRTSSLTSSSESGQEGHRSPREARGVIFTPDLPKTRGGKIMPRGGRGVAEGEDDLGDTSTLADHSVVDDLTEARSQS